MSRRMSAGRGRGSQTSPSTPAARTSSDVTSDTHATRVPVTTRRPAALISTAVSALAAATSWEWRKGDSDRPSPWDPGDVPNTTLAPLPTNGRRARRSSRRRPDTTIKSFPRDLSRHLCSLVFEVDFGPVGISRRVTAGVVLDLAEDMGAVCSRPWDCVVRTWSTATCTSSPAFTGLLRSSDRRPGWRPKLTWMSAVA